MLYFFSAFALNILWEYAHVILYMPFSMGQPLTEFALFRSALVDAFIILILVLPFALAPSLKKHTWLIVPIGCMCAVGIEWYAPATGMWAYNSLMPIIPFLSVGLTPAIQLGILGYVSYKVDELVMS